MDAKTECDIGIIINEMGDQVECAAYLAERFPDVLRRDMDAIIADCERGLLQMGFGRLDELRRCLAATHPAWRAEDDSGRDSDFQVFIAAANSSRGSAQ